MILMIEPTTIIATATAIATVVFNKAIEQSGREVGKAVTDKIGQILTAVQNKFKGVGMEGALPQAGTNPTEESKNLFQQVLTMQMNSDPQFAEKLIELKEQLEKLEGGRQIMASGLKVKDFKAQDMKQKGAAYQKMLTDVEGENFELGNLTQEN